MTGKIPTVLYLDCDYALTLSPRLAGDIKVVLIPEVVFDKDTVSSSIDVKRDLALDPSGNRMSVYHPTPELLMKIRKLTESGGIDIVVLGNNMGAGVTKAPYIVRSLRTRTIVMAISWPNQGDYEPLGYKHFISRGLLAVRLRELIATLT